MAITERPIFKSNINAFLPDNTQRLISEKDVRDRFLEVEESFIHKISGFDIPAYSPSTTYAVGDSVTYNSDIYRKINTSAIGQLPTNLSHWSKYASNPFSTETKWGLVKKAQVSDLLLPTNNELYITPYLLNEFLTIIGGVESLDDLSDVDLGVLADGQALIYDLGTGQWRNGNVVSDNIYISDGTLTGNRTVNGGNNSLTLTGFTQFSVDSEYIEFTVRDGTTNGLIIDDQRTVKTGAEYNADYSVTYTDRSLADWGSIKTRISTIVGIPSTDTDLGTFTGTIIPDSSSVKSALQALETAFGSITFNNGNGTTWNSIANAYDLGGSLNQATSVLTGANALQLSINNNSGSISISDTRAITQGIVYATDYSAGFSARSLVDRGFVETEESQLIGNVLGEDFLTFTNTAYIPDGNYTVKAALDALSAGLSPFTQGSVIFANALGELAEDNANLFYDNALNYLGVNTNTPDAPLSLVGRMSFKSPTLLNRTVKINSDGNGQDDLCIAINVISGTQTGAFNSFIANNDAVGLGAHSASNTIQIGGTGYAAYNSVGLLANSNNNSVAIGYGSGVNGSSNLGIEPSVIVGYLNTGYNINALGNSSGALIYGYNNEVTANFNAASGSTAIVLGANNQVYQNRTGSNLLQKFVIGKSITDTQETVLKDSFGVGIGSYAFLHDLTQKNWLNGGLLLTDAGYDQSSTNSSYYKLGIAPISTPIDSSALYIQDYNYANSAVAGTAAPYFRTEEGRTLSVRRAHHRDFLLEFFPSLETVRYISFDWSTAVLIKEFQFDTNQIDSLTVRFRKSSAGSASAYTGPYTISNPLNTSQIDTLNSDISVAVGAGSVELQITANFDIAWTTQAQVQIITEPNLIR